MILIIDDEMNTAEKSRTKISWKPRELLKENRIVSNLDRDDG